MDAHHHDLDYSPDVDLEVLRQARLVTRVLLLGTRAEQIATTPTTDVRRSEQPPGGIGSNGVYAFRTAEGWDLMVAEGGGAPSEPAAAREGDGHPLEQARRWFDFLWPNAALVAPERRFADNALVQIGGTDSKGYVLGSALTGSGWLYTVMVGTESKKVMETGLEAVDQAADDPQLWIQLGAGSARELAATLTFTKLDNPLTDTLYSYLSTKTVFRPYQFRPILKLLNSPHQRLLIADEVGLGKTIEAGLVWVELEQRTSARRLLVICPAALVTKWQTEMRRRFDRELTILDKPGIERLIKLFEEGDTETPIHAVISLERLRISPLLDRLSGAQPTFDLLVVDEAHYLRNSGTASNDLGHTIADWADTLLFLSATPLNLGNSDLFNLLNILVEDEYPDEAVFPQQLAPNRYLNKAARALTTGQDDPRRALGGLAGIEHCQFGPSVTQRLEFARLRELLDRDGSLSWEELAEARRLIVELNTLSGVMSRTRKVEVETADRPVRVPVRIDVDWSAEEFDLYREIMTWTQRRAAANGVPPGFAMQMPLRQAASCLPAMLELLRERNPELAQAETLADFDEGGGDDTAWLDEDLRGLAARSRTVQRDTKVEAFLTRMDEARASGLGQMMVFSFFRRTLEYLRQQLVARGWKVRVMHGGTKMPDRERIMQDFRHGDFEILLCSEVASEGLDFEFCNVLVNYDLPWNPMKVEQRIGRLDRFGQVHPKIFIYNFHVPGTIETDIFERLYDRIDVFRQSIGELEPILRDELSDLHQEALGLALSPGQLDRRMSQIEVALVNRRKDLKDLSDAEDFLSGVDQLLIEGFERDTEQRGRFIGKRELRRFVAEFLLKAARLRLPGNDNDDRVELKGDGELANLITRILGRTPRDLVQAQPFLRRLRDEEPILLTFDNEDASRTSHELLSIRHPLVKAAAAHQAAQAAIRRYGAVQIRGSRRVTDDHVVVIYLAATTGLRASLELWPVSVRAGDGGISDGVGDELFSALANGKLADAEPLEQATVQRLAAVADGHVHQLLAAREAESRRDNEALVVARMETQRASIELKIARATDRLADARARGHHQIARLHEGHIANLGARLEQALADLEKRRRLSVTVQPIAVVCVRGSAHGR